MMENEKFPIIRKNSYEIKNSAGSKKKESERCDKCNQILGGNGEKI